MKKFLFLMLFVFGCEPLDGIVINKRTVPEHTETHWVTVGGVGKNSFPISVPVTSRIATQYFIEIQEESKCTYEVMLSKEDYESYKINDKYPHREKP